MISFTKKLLKSRSIQKTGSKFVLLGQIIGGYGVCKKEASNRFLNFRKLDRIAILQTTAG